MERNLSQEDLRLIEEINILKREKQAVILVHNYQLPEIYEVADLVGDSFGLSREASKTEARIIIFCGVDFMAESAAILSPDKKVYLPAREAKCPMAAMVDAEGLENLKLQYPQAAVVCYINTSAEVKAVSDICCTSSNAVKIVNSLPNKEIIFVPDKNLAHFVSRHTDKTIIPWQGVCYVHHLFASKLIQEAKELRPGAEVIVHPECPPEVIDLADYVCSTSQMIKYAKESRAREFIVCTEIGMLYRLKKELPDKNFYSAPQKVCVQMKKNRLELVRDSLLLERYIVEVPEEIRRKAKRALDKMLKMGI